MNVRSKTNEERDQRTDLREREFRSLLRKEPLGKHKNLFDNMRLRIALSPFFPKLNFKLVFASEMMSGIVFIGIAIVYGELSTRGFVPFNFKFFDLLGQVYRPLALSWFGYLFAHFTFTKVVKPLHLG